MHSRSFNHETCCNFKFHQIWASIGILDQKFPNNNFHIPRPVRMKLVINNFNEIQKMEYLCSNFVLFTDSVCYALADKAPLIYCICRTPPLCYISALKLTLYTMTYNQYFHLEKQPFHASIISMINLFLTFYSFSTSR